MIRKQARIRDVAEIAGVSTATVSRVLSNPDLVSQSTRSAVEAAIAQTGYRPNEAARNLRHRRTGGIVALVPDLANPFFAKILWGIASVLSPAGYNLLIADTRAGDRDRLADYADPSRADGLINLDGALPLAMLQGRVPVIEACEWVPGLKAPKVRIDNSAAAALAVAHLAGLGHRRIAHVAGPEGNVLSLTRADGFRAALSLHGLIPAECRIYPGDFSLDSGRQSARLWLAEPPQARATAVFLASDAMACGFIAEVTRHGIQVPRDVSVVGFDDIELTSHLAPPLTTIHQPRAKIGQVAAEQLIAKLEGRSVPDETLVPVELILRSSTAPPR